MDSLDFFVTLSEHEYPVITPAIDFFAFFRLDGRLIRWFHLYPGATTFLFEITADHGACGGVVRRTIENQTGELVIPQDLLGLPGSISWTVTIGAVVGGSAHAFSSAFDISFDILKPGATTPVYNYPNPKLLTYPTGITCRPLAGRFDIPRVPILPSRKLL